VGIRRRAPKKGANVRWACKLCEKTYTGGPQKIRAHFLQNLIGCVTCDAAGEERNKANEVAQKHLDDEVRKKHEKDAIKRRKALALEAERAAKARKVQARVDASSSCDYSRAHLTACGPRLASPHPLRSACLRTILWGRLSKQPDESSDEEADEADKAAPDATLAENDASSLSTPPPRPTTTFH
jgi:hypothetical protein